MPASSALDTHALEVFLAVAEAGGMTAAAKRLHISQSGVSQIISNLEKDLGVPLIDRSIRPPALTSAGRVLYERASGLLTEIRELRNDVRKAAKLPAADLRLGMDMSFAAVFGPHLARALRGRIARLRVNAGQTPKLVESFMTRELDMIVVSDDELAAQPGFAVTRLFTEPYILALPQGFDGEANALAGLAQALDFVRYGAHTTVGRNVEMHLSRLKVHPPMVYAFDNTDSLLAMVAGGLGWAVTTPMCVLQSHAHARDVRFEPLPGPQAARPVCLIARLGELDALSARIARTSIGIVTDHFLPALRQLMPWAVERIVIESAEEAFASPR